MKLLYKYPQAAYPYNDLVATNARRDLTMIFATGFLAEFHRHQPAPHDRQEIVRFPCVRLTRRGSPLPSTTDGRKLAATGRGKASPTGPSAPKCRPTPIRGTSMIYQHGKTDLLIARLKELLPIEANIRRP